VAIAEADYVTVPLEDPALDEMVPPEKMDTYLAELEAKMREAARRFDFKQAAAIRDRLQELKSKSVLDAASPSMDAASP
jgi:excinuclease UvrABC helicase subunit UvrB